MSSISSVSGQVAVAVGFLTRDPSLIWNTVPYILNGQNQPIELGTLIIYKIKILGPYSPVITLKLIFKNTYKLR